MELPSPAELTRLILWLRYGPEATRSDGKILLGVQRIAKMTGLSAAKILEILKDGAPENIYEERRGKPYSISPQTQ